MTENAMIDDLVAQLDAGFAKGVGHFNVHTDDTESTKQVQTLGCNDCSRSPLMSSSPKLQQGLDAFR